MVQHKERYESYLNILLNKVIIEECIKKMRRMRLIDEKVMFINKMIYQRKSMVSNTVYSELIR